MIDKSIFKNLKADVNKLKAYGFKQENDVFSFEKNIYKNNYRVVFTIKNLNQVSVDVFELETQEKLDLFYILNTSGSFSNEINSLCTEIAKDIIENCFEKDIFKSEQSKKIISYIKKTYGDELEFLWPKFPDNAIWRRKDNRKWYALLLTISQEKLKFNSKEKIEILDLRVDKEKIFNLIDNNRIFEGYHMNKKSWITIPLNNSLPNEKIFSLIDKSYILAKK